MYLHLGQGVVVPYRDVLALFDLDNTSASHLTRRFLERAEQAGQVVNVAEDLPKSFVLCRPAGGEATVYLSQLSTATLLGPPEAAPAAGPQGRPLAARISQWRFSNV